MSSIRIYTIGHSVRTEKEFIDLLKQNQIQLLVDVRTIPNSRRNPQFNSKHLETALQASGVKYVHFPELGGLRKPLQISVNAGWKNPGFRGYADHMASEQFAEAIERLIKLASETTSTIMCAEAYYRKCHRMLLSDALTVRNVDVIHIVNEKQLVPHVLTSFAKVEGTKITYPAEQSDLQF